MLFVHHRLLIDGHEARWDHWQSSLNYQCSCNEICFLTSSVKRRLWRGNENHFIFTRCAFHHSRSTQLSPFHQIFPAPKNKLFSFVVFLFTRIYFATFFDFHFFSLFLFIFFHPAKKKKHKQKTNTMLCTMLCVLCWLCLIWMFFFNLQTKHFEKSLN